MKRLVKVQFYGLIVLLIVIGILQLVPHPKAIDYILFLIAIVLGGRVIINKLEQKNFR